MLRHVLFIFLIVLGCRVSSLAQATGKSLVEIKAAAEAGDPAAQDVLAQQYMQRSDTKQAELWYRKAADQGYAPAQGKLGNMLLMRSSQSYNITAPERVALGHEVIMWATLAANQGDKRGQADLAGVYFEGKLVKQDLIEAYKWGDLATQGLSYDVTTITGTTIRDNVILKMSSSQIAEAQKRVAAFKPHKPDKNEPPEPSWVKQIKLSGLTGAPPNRVAIINNKTFSTGDTATVKVDEQTITVRCLEIREKSVMVIIQGLDKPRELSRLFSASLPVHQQTGLSSRSDSAQWRPAGLNTHDHNG